MLGERHPQQPWMRLSVPGGPNPAPGPPGCCFFPPSQGTPYPRLSLPWCPRDTLQDPLCHLLCPKAAPAFAGPQGRGIGALPPPPWAPTPCPLFFTPPQHHTWSLLSPGARLLPTWETCPSWHLKRTARVIAGAGIRSDRIPTHPVAEGSGCRIFFTRVSPTPPHLLHAHPGLE